MRKIFVTVTLTLVTLASYAITPLWLRDVKISPKGDEILFCYKGDIYKCPSNGGNATQLTTQISYESSPIWSSDGKMIAFESDRYGSQDVFVMNSNGGSARRVTSFSGKETPSSFSNDGKYIFFSANIQDPTKSVLYPSPAMKELYKVPVNGGRIEQELAVPAEMIDFSADGNNFLYQDNKGFENEWRKHHTSSITRDIWLFDRKTGKHTNLTQHAGEDRNPSFSPDGKSVLFLSERNGGSMNVYSFPISDRNKVKALTSFTTNPVRFLSVANNGTMCYSYNGEIFTQKNNGSPKKVFISLTRDDEDEIANLSSSSGSSEATPSPDGKQVAFIVRGEVFVTSADYITTKQITHTPEREAGLTFSSDNRTIAYASERNGNWQIVTAKISRKEDLNFANATLIEEEVILPSKTIERTYPKFSPDGKELAFIQDRRKLMVYNFASKKVREITDGSTWINTSGGFDYSWSPDSKWFTLCYTPNKHDPYYDIGLVSSKGGKITNITNSGYMNTSPKWAMGGNAIIYETEKYGMRNHASWGSQNDVMMVFLNKDSYDKFRLSKEDYELQKELEKQQATKKEEDKKDEKKKDKKGNESKYIVVELDNIEDRIVRLTPNSSKLLDAIITKDGETLYYLSSFEGGCDMWKLNLRDRSTRLVNKINSGWASMEADKSGRNIFILSGNSIQKMDASSGSMKSISFYAKFKMDLAKEREYMYDHVCKQEKKRFYNLNMHGVDWEKMCDNYRKFLPHINNNYDFSELLSELLGELNVSHTGASYRKSNNSEATANLGLLFDLNYKGDGLKIDEILEKGPFDRSSTKVKNGDIVEKINGESIKGNADFFTLLNGKTNKKTLISLYNPSTKERWDEVILPISYGSFNNLLYKRWVKQRAEDVNKWSNGKLGYVHIESMDDESFRKVYSDILGKYNKCEGIVIDTRFNGGGRLHEDIEVLFSGHKYFTQVIRGEEACDMPSRRWNKPSIMIQCEANYSNAHGTPWVYKNRGLGKLVGMPVPGTMTSVQWETLQDPSLYFGIPIIGYRLPDGSYLENQQLEPDIKVINSPETVVNGEDTQLKVAVDELMKDIKKNK